MQTNERLTARKKTLILVYEMELAPSRLVSLLDGTVVYLQITKRDDFFGVDVRRKQRFICKMRLEAPRVSYKPVSESLEGDSQ